MDNDYERCYLLTFVNKYKTVSCNRYFLPISSEMGWFIKKVLPIVFSRSNFNPLSEADYF